MSHYRFNPHARECLAGGVWHGNDRIAGRCRDCRDVRQGRAPNVVADRNRRGWRLFFALYGTLGGLGIVLLLLIGAMTTRSEDGPPHEEQDTVRACVARADAQRASWPADLTAREVRYACADNPAATFP